MTKIAIATPTLIEGDAVGNDVIGMSRTLMEAGYEVRLYADTSRIAWQCDQLKHLKDVDIFIYHHSIVCDSGVRKFKELDCRKILKYHNITPPHFFPIEEDVADACQRGLDQISTLLDEPCEVWADSVYNGEHLREFADIEYTVIPPYNQVEMMENVMPDYQSVLHFDDWNTNIIMVGRVARNKNVMRGIEAFGEYYKFNKHSRLIIVGDAGGLYANEVLAKIKELGIGKNVCITGKVTLEALKACYLIADALLITSKHEGFCVPMVEAMAMNVPVVSNRLCALPYTGGDAVHYTDDDPKNIALGIAHVVKHKTHFIEKGKERFFKNYRYLAIADAVLDGIISKDTK